MAASAQQLMRSLSWLWRSDPVVLSLQQDRCEGENTEAGQPSEESAKEEDPPPHPGRACDGGDDGQRWQPDQGARDDQPGEVPRVLQAMVGGPADQAIQT